jgi:hypothetical protein
MPDCVSKNAVEVGKGGWNQLHKEVLQDLYILSVVRTSIGLHILSAEYNRLHHHHHRTHELDFSRPISDSSNSLFKGLPSRLLPFGLLFCIIFGILLLVIIIY